MSIVSFAINIFLIAMLCAAIHFFKWCLNPKHVQYSKNRKTRRIEKFMVKTAIGICYCFLVLVVFATVTVLIAPLIEALNTAFVIAISKIIAFVETLIPWAVLAYIGSYWWKNRKDKKDEKKPPIPIPTFEDYKKLGEIVNKAVQWLPKSIGLAAVNNATNILVKGNDWLTQHGKVYRLKYRFLKQSNINKSVLKQVLQDKIQDVLDTEMPLAFTGTTIWWNCEAHCVIQVDYVDEDDAYAYVYCVIAMDATYFEQRDEMERKAGETRTAPTDDEDF